MLVFPSQQRNICATYWVISQLVLGLEVHALNAPPKSHPGPGGGILI